MTKSILSRWQDFCQNISNQAKRQCRVQITMRWLEAPLSEHPAWCEWAFRKRTLERNCLESTSLDVYCRTFNSPNNKQCLSLRLHGSSITRAYIWRCFESCIQVPFDEWSAIVRTTFSIENEKKSLETFSR